MNDRKKELEQELEAIQKEIEESLTEIRDDINSWTDAKYWVHRYPFQTVGASLLLGFLISQVTGRKKKSFAGGSLTTLFFNEVKKYASRSAANYIVKIVEENLERKRKVKDIQ
ncbi:MAG: hypothetical protein WEB89_03535 [Balneolales bacterium]